MNKFIRYYNQNRKNIWIGIFAVIVVIIIVHALDTIARNNSELEKQENERVANILKQEDYKENPDISVTISDSKVKEQNQLIIDQFIRYCNAGEIENAYNLLTDDCKNELYPNIEIFKSNYINIIFNSTKLYSKEQYNGKTYKVKLYEDIMATGRVSNSVTEDYYTLEIQGDSTKLNISGYIGNENINKNYSNNFTNINIISKKIFKEYEEYKIEIENKTNRELVLDGMENTKSTYLMGKENVKYYALIHEKTLEDMTIHANVKKTIILRFNKPYTSNNVVERGIVFSNIIVNTSKTGIEIAF